MNLSRERNLQHWLGQRALARDQRQLQRRRQALSGKHAVSVQKNSTALINFSSNDYLGLAGHPDLVNALSESAQNSGVGSGASALVSGYRREHQQLEQELAEYLQRDSVLLCSSGYLANLAIATSLTDRHDHIVQDKLCHASLIDAARLSEAKLLRYKHADTQSLDQQLHTVDNSSQTGHTLVVSDGVFSMDGDTAPLATLADISQRHEAWLSIDDAHGIGVCGPDGRGSVAAAGLTQQQVPVLSGTLGKAFGCFGAFIGGSESLTSHLVNESRSYIYTTAMPPAVAAAARVALKHVREDQWRRDHLESLIGLFREGASCRGLKLMDSLTPIQPILIGDSGEAMAIAQKLEKLGFLVVAIRPPTVAKGSARLRITLTAAHQPEQVTNLLDAIEKCLTP